MTLLSRFKSLLPSRKLDVSSRFALLRKAISGEPRLQEAHYNLGRVFSATKRFDEALEAWEKATEINPKSPVGSQAQMASALVQRALEKSEESGVPAGIKVNVPGDIY